jgi:pimeloyl-ACP methyl ester carboxylesterase
MLKYIPIFKELGYNVVLYDNRFHGESGGGNITFGHYEKHDLQQIVSWALEQLGNQGLVGTMGESLGAAITLQHAAIDDRIHFAIADSSFSNLHELFKYRLRYDFHLPGWLTLPLTSFWCRLFYGFSFYSIAIPEMLQNVFTPILFICGQEDKYIPPVMTKELHKAKINGVRELHIFPRARHAQSYNSNPNDYTQIIRKFIESM